MRKTKTQRRRKLAGGKKCYKKLEQNLTKLLSTLFSAKKKGITLQNENACNRREKKKTHKTHKTQKFV